MKTIQRIMSIVLLLVVVIPFAAQSSQLNTEYLLSKLI